MFYMSLKYLLCGMAFVACATIVEAFDNVPESISARMDIASRVRRFAENTALSSWMQDLAQSIIVYRQEPNLCREDNQVVTK
jgi:hypothetical protein